MAMKKKSAAKKAVKSAAKKAVKKATKKAGKRAGTVKTLRAVEAKPDAKKKALQEAAAKFAWKKPAKPVRGPKGNRIPVEAIPAGRPAEEIPVIRGEGAARRYLESVRWPHGVKCPRCGGAKLWEIAGRDQQECVACGYQFSVTAGTAFAGSHVPLEKWLKCVKLQCREGKGLSARRVAEELGVTYKTAWYLCHRVRAAMGAAAGRRRATWETWMPMPGAALLDEGVKAAWITISDKHKTAYVGESRFRHRYEKPGERFKKVVEELLKGEAVGYEELTGE
ncbi:MAG TPA: IS1595 family transposase [Terracidiphilus sp.]|nr:IS1595 family transposase [Terracidiphilus sp.]